VRRFDRLELSSRPVSSKLCEKDKGVPLDTGVIRSDVCLMDRGFADRSLGPFLTCLQ
jgi:hypothetical protein